MKKNDNVPQTARENAILMSVPTLPPERSVPAAIHSISIIKSDGEPDVMRIVIKRDLTRPIRSFTFRYRFSTLPIAVADNEHKFSTFLYDESDINTTELITVSGNVPTGLVYGGCSAYISEIVLESGQIVTFDTSEYRFVRRPIKKQPSDVPSPATALPDAKLPADKEHKPDKEPQTETEAQKKKRIRRTVILTVFIFMLIIEAIGGVYLYRYLGVKNSVDMLIRENRYNEAYKIASDSDYSGLLQSVCEKASVYYFAEGDLEASYVYAYGAPDPFTDMIIDYAAQSVIDNTTGKINENAFRVAKMSDNDEKFDSIIHTIVGMLESRGDFSNALRVVSELRDPADRDASEDTVLINAFSYFSSNHRYQDAAAFIDNLENVTTVDRTKAEIIDFAVNCYATLGDNAGIIYIAHRYPEYADASAANANVLSGDAGVRSELKIVYPMLSADQKRSYHSNTLALWNKELFSINKSGELGGTDIKNAVSVDTSEAATLVLCKDGSVTLLANEGFKLNYTIPQYNDVVAIALGEDHAVLLHDNGTVTVHGSNAYGQANVSDWTDIVAIAAGQRFTVGLKLDGSVVAAGSNSCGQCNVDIYFNVVDIAACNQTTVMLFSDGKVMIQGYRSLGLEEIENVTDAKRIEAGGAAIVVERSDGTYELYTGQSGGDYGNPYNWRNIVSFDVGLMSIAAIDKAGELYSGGSGLPK